MAKSVKANNCKSTWRLEKNDIWNIPEGVHEVRFEYETRGPWRIISKVRGLCIDLDGNIYGLRSLQKPKESGYCLAGYVSVGGKTVRAFTSSKLFQRPDGSLCDVAVLVACFCQNKEQNNG